MLPAVVLAACCRPLTLPHASIPLCTLHYVHELCSMFALYYPGSLVMILTLKTQCIKDSLQEASWVAIPHVMIDHPQPRFPIPTSPSSATVPHRGEASTRCLRPTHGNLAAGKCGKTFFNVEIYKDIIMKYLYFSLKKLKSTPHGASAMLLTGCPVSKDRGVEEPGRRRSQ